MCGPEIKPAFLDCNDPLFPSQLREMVGSVVKATDNLIVLKCASTISISIADVQPSTKRKWQRLLKVGNVIGILVMDSDDDDDGNGSPDIRIRLVSDGCGKGGPAHAL